MTGMFEGAAIEDSGIGDWNTASLEDAATMFKNAGHLSRGLDLSGWTMGKCTNVVSMFQYSAIIDSKIGEWKVNDRASTICMFSATNFNGIFGRGWPDAQRANALLGVNRGTVPVNTASFGKDDGVEETIRAYLARATRKMSAERAEPECTIL
jgi:hypothetical protein